MCASLRIAQWNSSREVGQKIAALCFHTPRHLSLRAIESDSTSLDHLFSDSNPEHSANSDIFSRVSKSLTYFEKCTVWFEHKMLRYMRLFSGEVRKSIDEFLIASLMLFIGFIHIKITESGSAVVLLVPYSVIASYCLYYVYKIDHEHVEQVVPIDESDDDQKGTKFNALLANIMFGMSLSSSDKETNRYFHNDEVKSDCSVFSDEELIESSLSIVDHILGDGINDKSNEKIDKNEYLAKYLERNTAGDAGAAVQALPDINDTEDLISMIDEMLGMGPSINMQIERRRAAKNRPRKSGSEAAYTPQAARKNL